MRKVTIEVPEGQTLYVQAGRDEMGKWWPRAVLVIAKDEDEARQKAIEDEVRDRDEDTDLDEDELRKHLQSEAGFSWDVLEVYLESPPIS